MFVQLIKLSRDFIKQIFSAEKKHEKESVRIYKKLTNWGMFRGITCTENETALAYSQRLSDNYPQHSKAFFTIAQNFCKEKYSPISLSVAEEIEVKTAYKHRTGFKAFFKQKKKRQ